MSQKVRFGHPRCDVDVPVPLHLLKDEVVELIGQGGCTQCCPYLPPDVKKRFWRVLDAKALRIDGLYEI